MHTKKSYGFGLMEVMIAGVVMALTMAAFMAFLDYANKGQKNIQNAVDFDLLKTTLNQLFATKACNGSLYSGSNKISFSFPVGMTPSMDIAPVGGFVVDEIKHGTVTVVKLGDQLTGGLTVTKLALVSLVYDGDQSITDPLTSVTTTYKAFSSLLRVEIKKADGAMGRKTLVTKPDIPVRILADATSGIAEKCGMPSSALTKMHPFERETSPGVPFACNTVYQAAHDGFIVASGRPFWGQQLGIYAGANSAQVSARAPQTQIAVENGSQGSTCGGAEGSAVTSPVAKDSYWLVDCGSGCYWEISFAPYY